MTDENDMTTHFT